MECVEQLHNLPIESVCRTSVSSVGIGVPSTVLMKASIKLYEMTGKGQLQNAKIGPDDVIIKKLR